MDRTKKHLQFKVGCFNPLVAHGIERFITITGQTFQPLRVQFHPQPETFCSTYFQWWDDWLQLWHSPITLRQFKQETQLTNTKILKKKKKHISGWWWNRLVNHTFIHTINTDSRCLHDVTQRCHSSLQLQPKLRNFGCDRCIPGRSWLLPWWPMGPEKNRVSWYIESTYKAVQQFQDDKQLPAIVFSLTKSVEKAMRRSWVSSNLFK